MKEEEEEGEKEGRRRKIGDFSAIRPTKPSLFPYLKSHPFFLLAV